MSKYFDSPNTSQSVENILGTITTLEANYKIAASEREKSKDTLYLSTMGIDRLELKFQLSEILGNPPPVGAEPADIENLISIHRQCIIDNEKAEADFAQAKSEISNFLTTIYRKNVRNWVVKRRLKELARLIR